MPTGRRGRRTTCPSGRSICSTTRSCASPCDRRTSSRALGHFRDDALGLNLIYVHMNWAIRQRDLNAIYVTGLVTAGHAVANAHLRGDVPERYPDVSEDETGLRRCSASSRSRAESRATLRPRCRARSTRAASWPARSSTRSARRSTTPTWSSPASSATARPRRPGRQLVPNKFLNARTDGAVLPILHPQRLQDREPDRGQFEPGGRAHRALPRVRLGAAARRGRGAPTCASGLRGRARPVIDRTAEIQRAARDERARRRGRPGR